MTDYVYYVCMMILAWYYVAEKLESDDWPMMFWCIMCEEVLILSIMTQWKGNSLFWSDMKLMKIIIIWYVSIPIIVTDWLYYVKMMMVICRWWNRRRYCYWWCIVMMILEEMTIEILTNLWYWYLLIVMCQCILLRVTYIVLYHYIQCQYEIWWLWCMYWLYYDSSDDIRDMAILLMMICEMMTLKWWYDDYLLLIQWWWYLDTHYLMWPEYVDDDIMQLVALYTDPLMAGNYLTVVFL